MEKNVNEQSLKNSGIENNNAKGGKFLTFFLGNEEYGLPILSVQEIIALLPITPVPRTPDFFKGLTNLRGKIIPIMDLRIKFGMEANEPTEETCIIVVRTANHLIGIIVDKVSEVKNIHDEQIDEPPEFGKNAISEYLFGIGKSDDSVILLVNIEEVVSTAEISEVNSDRADDDSLEADENIS